MDDRSRSRSRDRDQDNYNYLIGLQKGRIVGRKKRLLQSIHNNNNSREARSRRSRSMSHSNNNTNKTALPSTLQQQNKPRSSNNSRSAKRARSSPPKSSHVNKNKPQPPKPKRLRFHPPPKPLVQQMSHPLDYRDVSHNKNIEVTHIIDQKNSDDDEFMDIDLPTTPESVPKILKASKKSIEKCHYIEAIDNALAMNESAKATFDEIDGNSQKKQTNCFKIKITKKSTRNLRRDSSKYKTLDIEKNLKLQKFTLSSIPRGSSPCWKIFHSIINDKNELVDKYAFCIHCLKVYSKGGSTTNLNKHYKEVDFEQNKENADTVSTTRNEKNDSSENDNSSQTKQIISLSNGTINELRISTMFMVNSTFSAFAMVDNKQYKDHCQALINAGAKHGSFDVEKLEITPFKIKSTTGSTARSIVQTQREIISNICKNNVLPPVAFTADIYGDKHLQRANIGVALFAVIDYEIKEMSLGVIPMEGIKEYILKNEGSNDCEFDDDDFLENGDEENPGGYRTLSFVDAEGVEHSIKMPVKNWINIQNALRKIIKLYGIENKAKEIFNLIFTTDRGGNIKLALEQWLFFLGLICMAHRLSTVCKTGLKLTRESVAAFDNMYKACSSLINIINKSSWRAKMKPSLKTVVPTRFWGNESMWGSVIPNYQKMKAFARNFGHEEKIRWQEDTARSIYTPFRNIKSLIKQIESRTLPTTQLFMPSITTLHNVKLKSIQNEATYSTRFKSNTRRQIVEKIIPGSLS